MMSYSQSDLAKKYAAAYLNLHGKDYTFRDVYTMWRASQFLSEHHNLLFYLSLSMIDKDSKERFIDLFIQKFNLFGSIKDLFFLMIKHKNIFLAADVLKDIYGIYKRRNNICDLQVVSSSELSDERVDDLKQFFEKQIGCNAIVSKSVDPALIAGVRLQTDTHLWEYSVAKQLRKLKQDLLV